MILSHMASSCFDMSLYQATWIHFRPKPMDGFPDFQTKSSRRVRFMVWIQRPMDRWRLGGSEILMVRQTNFWRLEGLENWWRLGKSMKAWKILYSISYTSFSSMCSPRLIYSKTTPRDNGERPESRFKVFLANSVSLDSSLETMS